MMTSLALRGSHGHGHGLFSRHKNRIVSHRSRYVGNRYGHHAHTGFPWGLIILLLIIALIAVAVVLVIRSKRAKANAVPE